MKKQILALAILASSLQGQSRNALAARLDSIAAADVVAGTAVGLQFAVVRGNEQLLLKSYGKADAEGNTALTNNTVLGIGSVTKQFTAAAILQLRDAGKLGIDDELTKWLPEFGDRARGVTLRHLLGHTSGAPDQGSMPEFRAMQMLRNATVSRDSVYTITARYPFEFPAGSQQAYSNTGYWLLGRVVEKASGMSWEQYIQKRIFEPLGMTRSMNCNDAQKASDRSYGHNVRNGQVRRVPDIVHTATIGSGAICSTAGDMVKWLQGLHGGKVVSAQSYAEMIAPTKLDDGTATQYGMALTVWKDARGLKEIGHNGGGFGYSSQAWWHPDSKLALVILTNSEPDKTTAENAALTSAVLGEPKAAQAYTGNASQFAGRFAGKAGSREMVIEVSPQLTYSVNGAPAKQLSWVEGATFRDGDAQLSFRPSELHFDTGGDHLILKPQAAPPKAAAVEQQGPDSATRARQAQFVGYYQHIERPERGFEVFFKNDTLTMKQGRNSTGQSVRLVWEKGTTYHVDIPGARGTWEFKLGTDGKTAQLVHVEPGLELVFVRVP
jgi:CubicO group peptidase (beta-lactamase class C family)